MFIKHLDQIAEEIPTLEGTKSCTVRWLIGQKDGAKNYAMRLFELQPNGIIPLHFHEETEHEIFVVEGEGVINDGENDIKGMKDCVGGGDDRIQQFCFDQEVIWSGDEQSCRA